MMKFNSDDADYYERLRLYFL